VVEVVTRATGTRDDVGTAEVVVHLKELLARDLSSPSAP